MSRPVIAGKSRSNTPRLAPNHNLCSRRSWIENLRYAVEVFDEWGNLIEVLAWLYDLDAAHAAYYACRRKRPTKLIMLCQKGQIIRRSDREGAEVRTL